MLFNRVVSLRLSFVFLRHHETFIIRRIRFTQTSQHTRAHTTTHTHTRSPMRSVSCRSRPDCPFRCNLICTPIILCFSGGRVSRALSQHVDLFSSSSSSSICHCLSLPVTSSSSLSVSHLCQSSEEPTSHAHTCPVSASASPPPLSSSASPLPTLFLPIRGLGFSFPLPFWKYVGVELSFPAGVIDTNLG